MQFVGSIAKLTGEGNDLADNKLGDTARVGEGGVEDGDTMAGSEIEVDLVGTNAEAANDQQVLGLLEDLLTQLGLGVNANDVNFAKKTRSSAILSRARGRNTEGQMVTRGTEKSWRGIFQTYRIFSMSWSSGREVFRASTW